MRPTIQIFALFLAPLLSAAQNFLPTGADGNFPACAATCGLLQQAQSTCLAQTGQQSSGLAAENCFCQAATLQTLYSTPDAICVAECPTASDRVNLRTWFTSFCAQVGQGVDPNASATGGTSTIVVTSTSTNTNGPTSTPGTASGEQHATTSSKSWFSTHWKWIVMVLVLALGLGGLAWLLIFLRNRHRRKVDEHRAQVGGFPTAREKALGARAATPDLWGPHQHMNATQGWDYDGTTAAAVIPDERRERRSRREKAPATERRTSSRRAAHKPGSKTRHSATEVDEPTSASAKRPSSKRRSRADPDAIEVHRDPSASRSRTRRNRGSKFDFERDVEGQ